MRSLPILLAVLGVSLASEGSFLNFAKSFNKKYATTEEYNKRREIFQQNYNDMVRHNKEYEEGKVSWWRKVTEHYDLTVEEREVALNLGLPPVDREQMTETVDPLMEERIRARAAPDSWSWKDQGGVTSVKDQASCGSCAVFASVAAIDTCFWQVTGNLVDDLSEQHVMDCAYGYGYGNAGCDGGFMVSYMEWIKDENDGFVEMESCDPYTATDEFCTDDDSCNYGDDRGCEGANGCDVNHGVAVVGYGSEGGKDYWLIKNSWGRSWGENGFIRFKRGTGHCAVG